MFPKNAIYSMIPIGNHRKNTSNSSLSLNENNFYSYFWVNTTFSIVWIRQTTPPSPSWQVDWSVALWGRCCRCLLCWSTRESPCGFDEQWCFRIAFSTWPWGFEWCFQTWFALDFNNIIAINYLNFIGWYLFFK